MLMQIAYKDFAPLLLKKAFLGNEYEDLTGMVARVNEWIAQDGIKVINIETVIMPVRKKSTSEPYLYDQDQSMFQAIRVWYEA